MGKLVVFKLGHGNFQQGFFITLQIGEDGDRPSTEISGKLPPAPQIPQQYSCWQSAYRRLGWHSRLEAKAVQVTNISIINDCVSAVQVLCNSLNTWLHAESFRSIREKLLEKLLPAEEMRVVLQTEDHILQRLPWHLCDLFARYPQAEIALSAPVYERVKQASPAKSQVRILAILGHSDGIDTQADRALLEQLPNAEINFLVEPQRQELTAQLWSQGWDILFFAGHSASQTIPSQSLSSVESTTPATSYAACQLESAETGHISINNKDSLTIGDLKYALQTAVEHGLKLAIFNSCDGLGLAKELASLYIPQIIVMREPVPDQVAQRFLKYFLKAFAGGKSFYLSVREAREMLQGVEHEFPCASWLPMIYQNLAEAPPTWYSLQRSGDRSISPSRRSFKLVLLASIVITSLTIGVRQLGMLQPLELQAFDYLTRLRPSEEPDPRLLVVTVTEADIQAQNQEPGKGSLSDRSLERLLQKLEQYQPRAIGLDIYRSLPVQPKYANLRTRLQRNQRFIAVCKVSDPSTDDNIGVPPPPEIPKQRLGFSDVVTDDDNNIVRRHLLHLTPPLTSRCGTKYAFSLQLALLYLQSEGIQAKVTPQGHLQLSNVILPRLEAPTGGYQKFDASGYQLLLNYRPFQVVQEIAPQVTLEDVLDDRITPDLVKELKNRVILIGVTAPSASDYWFTPYSAGQQSSHKQIPGVFLQAQMVSQILSAVLDQRPLLWVWSQWSEIVWIWSWSLLGGVIAWRWRSLLHLSLALGAALGILSGFCFFILTQAGWIPLVPSVLVFLTTGGSILIYKYINFEPNR